jgi:dTDP-4-dehydrorhamnose 3,5-epimerase-like enzyme
MNAHKKSLIEFIIPDFEFKDDRGTLTQLFREGWSQVNYITSDKGAIRGGHYHENNIELFYIISGKIKLTLRELTSDFPEEYFLNEGDMFKIYSNISHSFEFLTSCQLISAYDVGVETDLGMDIHQG